MQATYVSPASEKPCCKGCFMYLAHGSSSHGHCVYHGKTVYEEGECDNASQFQENRE
ncbi:hypothetical protein QB910_000105 [Dabrowskivirus KKP3916]|uniref:Uncharacterized protein n=1 Tax=Alicyclobacillus phage KKP_3916 TaxID=3040651 RepID=A0AAT9V7N6_9CAUD|nr:hypothetical protein QB910_000105 [Alicyclobacillus phage KKP 3916]